MGDKTPHALTESIELRVVDADGNVEDYRTTGVDVYRVEKFTGKTATELGGAYTAIAYMAYSCAKRAGHAYRARKATTSEAELFEQWLEGHDVSLLVDDTDDQGDDGPKGDGPEPPADPLSPG